MSPVEAYLADLRTALGDRLPPAVQTARLREVRAHLLEAASEFGETEAVHRYGRARAVANGLVRAQRGYDARSAWTLALPLGAGFLTAALVTTSIREFAPPKAMREFLLFESGLMLLFLAIFFMRAVQTRRWIAWPIVTSHVGFLVLALALYRAAPQKVYLSETRDGVVRSRRLSSAETARFLAAHPQARRSEGLTEREVVVLAKSAAEFVAAWTLVNAAALGTGSLLDLRRVRRAR